VGRVFAWDINLEGIVSVAIDEYLVLGQQFVVSGWQPTIRLEWPGGQTTASECERLGIYTLIERDKGARCHL
jgi:hypothetical protein